jgi:hypothetical protein
MSTAHRKGYEIFSFRALTSEFVPFILLLTCEVTGHRCLA